MSWSSAYPEAVVLAKRKLSTKSGSMPDQSQNRVALVLGGTGMVGSNLLQLLEATEGWSSIAVSRRPPYFSMRGRHIACDLSDVEDCKTKLTDVDDVTHIFYCGHTPG